jgi:uncharacterized protein
MTKNIRLRRLEGNYSVCRLEARSAIPDWADGEGFVSISRSDDELSVVCRSERVPQEITQDGGWTCYKFIGPFAFDETGIVASVILPLSENGFGIFVVSTFDGDHLLLKSESRAAAEETLLAAGHRLM